MSLEQYITNMNELEKFRFTKLKAFNYMNKEEITELLKLQSTWLKCRENYRMQCKNNTIYILKQSVPWQLEALAKIEQTYKAKEKASDNYKNYHNTIINKYNTNLNK